MKTRYFLRLADDSLDLARPYRTRAAALAAFAGVARELDHYGQSIAASVHLAAAREDLAEYPDFVLKLGPRGGVQVQRA